MVDTVDRAAAVLAAIDGAHIVQDRDHLPRPLPTFHLEEVTMGKVLGTGGFGIVFEVKNFVETPESDAEADAGIEVSEDKKSGDSSLETHSDSSKDVIESNGVVGVVQNNATPRRREVSITATKDEDYFSGNLHVHYDVRKAKRWMVQHAMFSDQKPRYAIKRLQIGLTPRERARGMLDLAVEAKFLSIVWHPNIIKIRGVAEGDTLQKDFFIIMDRMYETLDTRMSTWQQEAKRHQSWGSLLGASNKNKRQILDRLMLDRLVVAYDMASALSYLHEHQLIYRDVKPANIGFDHRDDLKIFDFGLCKSLSPSLKAEDGEYGYRLTGQAGSLPYMAPEVVLCKTYDTKCDVFSFAILLWEMLSLQTCCIGYTPEQYVDRVTIHNERFPIGKRWPPRTRSILPIAWHADPAKRCELPKVSAALHHDIQEKRAEMAVTTEVPQRSRYL